MYKYVLSAIDIFSRFLWLVALESKSRGPVVRVLQTVYDQHGPPDRLQSDRGTECEGKLRAMCKSYKIKALSPAIPREGLAISTKAKEKDHV